MNQSGTVHPEVLVIGAGPAGLAIAGALSQKGLKFHLVDRSGKAGGAYRFISPEKKLLSPIRFLSLPGFPLESPTPYITAGSFRRYLKNYALHFALSIQQAEVLQVKKRNRGFGAYFHDGSVYNYKTVIVATGLFDYPFMPEVPGMEQAQTTFLHTKDLTRNSLKGRRVLVVGAGISGTEIAEEGARNHEAITLCSRQRRVWFLPPKIFGRDIVSWFSLVEKLPPWLLAPLCRKGFRIPGYNRGIRGFIAEGRVQLRRKLSHLHQDRAFFCEGSAETFDLIVFATGYRFRAPFLDEKVLSGGIRRCESARWPGLFFAGVPCGRGLDSQYVRGLARDAPKIVRYLRQLLDKK